MNHDIPEEIKNVIFKESKTHATLHGLIGPVFNERMQVSFIEGANRGYSLSLQTIADKESRIKQLEDEIKILEQTVKAYDKQIIELNNKK